MQEFRLEVENHLVFLYCSDLDSRLLLHEAERRGIALGGPWAAQYHRAHTTPGQNHIHVYYRNNQVFALNRDGTAHDRSHGVRIPNRVADAIRYHFPDIQLPPDNIIECATLEDEAELLLESPPGEP